MSHLVSLIAALFPLQDAPQVRSQVANGRTYLHVRLSAPADLRISRTQRKALDEIAPHDLARYPRLVPQDDGVKRVAWQFNAGGRLEFLGIVGERKAAKFKLLYPTEIDWKEVDLTIDVSTAVNVKPPATRNAKAPAEDDLEGRWAAAWERELAVRERLAGDSEAIRAVRQELVRKYGIASALPRPEIVLPMDDPALRTIPIGEIASIDPAEHPWRDLLAGREPPVEPLARLVPAEFWYARLRTPEGAPAVLDRLLRLAGVAAAVWDGAGEDHRLRQRYLRQLAFPIDLGGVRLPQHARETAVIGSDLHFRMGTDLTFLFAIDKMEAFNAEMSAGLAAARKEFGEQLRDESFQHRDVAVGGIATASGEVRSFRATIGTLAICSNSPAAMRRVIDVVRRQSPSLAESPEFRLMRGLFATDAPAEDVLLFFSETFLREQAGPRHRISLKRRANELQRNGIERRSALFSAWHDGAPPKEPVAIFSPPSIERAIDKISREEDDFYREWRERYRVELEPYLAPAAVRFQSLHGSLRAEAFAMAPRRADFWDEVRRKLGKGAVAREPMEFPGAAARLVMSFTPTEVDQARLRMWLIAKGVDKKHFAQKFEPLGDRVAVLIPDGPALAAVADHYWHADLTAEDLSKSRSDREGRWRLAHVPATLSVEVAKPLIFQGMLKRLKEIVREAWPKLLTWELLSEEYRRVKMQRVQPSAALLLGAFGKLLKPEESPGIYLASGEGKLVIAPSLEALKNGIDREIAPRRGRDAPERAAAWLTLNLAGSPELQKALRSFVEREAHRRALGVAALRQFLDECGVKDEAAAMRWLGFVPNSPDGTALKRDRERGEWASERHGTARQPVLNAEPLASSPWLRTLAEFGRVRGEMHVRPDGLLGVVVIDAK